VKSKASLARLPEHLREKELQKRKRLASALRRVTNDINQTFASDHGKRTLRYILDLCGYQKYSTSADPESGEINVQATIYNEARRNLYLKLRSFLKREILMDVENKGLSIDEEELDIYN